MKPGKIILIVLAGVLTLSCKSQYDALLKTADVDLKYRSAMKYYDIKKYLKAATLFDQLLLPLKGTEKDDTVQFYLGLSNYKYGDMTTAEANFEQFAQVFPRSPFTEEAKFLRIECLYEATHRY